MCKICNKCLCVKKIYGDILYRFVWFNQGRRSIYVNFVKMNKNLRFVKLMNIKNIGEFTNKNIILKEENLMYHLN